MNDIMTRGTWSGLSLTQGRRHVLNFRGLDNLLKTVGYIMLPEISLGLHVRVIRRRTAN